MKWVTREHPRTDRVACPWLIRKYIDPEAEIAYVPRDDVLGYAEREGAISFDAPGARYTHRDGKCSFETLVEEYKIDDPAISVLARVVHARMSQKIATRHRNRAASTRSPKDSRCSTSMISGSLNSSCQSMTPSSPGRKNNSTAPDGGALFGRLTLYPPTVL